MFAAAPGRATRDWMSSFFHSTAIPSRTIYLSKQCLKEKQHLILITGASDFIATHVVTGFLRAVYRVRGTVTSSETAREIRLGLPEYAERLSFAIVEDCQQARRLWSGSPRCARYDSHRSTIPDFQCGGQRTQSPPPCYQWYSEHSQRRP